MVRSSCESLRRQPSNVQKPPSMMPSQRESVVCVCATVALYLAYGSHARFVCHLFTSGPAAIHNLLMLRGEMTREQMSFTLLYWSLQGFLVIADSILNDLTGYYVAKFLVLTMMLAQAMGSSAGGHEEDASKAGLSKAASSAQAYNTLKAKQNSLFTETSMATKNRTSATDMRRGDVDTSEISTSSVTLPAPKDLNNTLMNCFTALQIQSPKEITESTCDPSTGDAKFTMTLGTTTVASSSPVHANPDLITTPGKTLTFSYPNRLQSVLYVTNRSDRRIMWAIKTNSRKRIAANPAFGMLAPGGYLQVDVAVNLEEPHPKEKTDRMSIDYMFVDDPKTGEPKFDHTLFLDDKIDKERKFFNVCYE
ncbi:hypothetical protein L596_014055 [Steinernema carpocapsae]|nr:hypothetical protein L596_014055 [Steinernema carpocapsae]